MTEETKYTLLDKISAGSEISDEFSDLARKVDQYYLEGVRNSENTIDSKVKADGWANVPLAVLDQYYDLKKDLDAVRVETEVAVREANMEVHKQHEYVNNMTSKWSNQASTSSALVK